MKDPILLMMGLSIFFVIAPEAPAQIKVKWTGNVQIGDDPASGHHSELAVQRFTIEQENYNSAVRARSEAPGSPHNFGVAAQVGEASILNQAIHGRVENPTANINYAGRFDGNVHITGTLTNPSDARMKENVHSLARTSTILPRLMQLDPQTFTYTQEPTFAQLILPQGEHFGLIAQDVERIFPELVTEELYVPFPDEDRIDNSEMEEIRYKSINYIEMIPILIQAIQKQQEMIDEQRTEIERLKTVLNR